mgnify:CR=1 FL=1
MTDSEKGLAGVTAADSELSYIDGEAGRLFYRGYDIHALAGQGSFAESLYLLWYGELPSRTALTVFEGLLAAERKLLPEVETVLRSLPQSATPMAALLTAVSVLSQVDEDAAYNDLEADIAKAGRIVSMLPVCVAAHHRLRLGLDPVAPDPNLPLAADFLRMLTDSPADEVAAKALDTSFLLYLEHGLNASTFSCRVVASTLADLYAAVSAGLAALSGPLHGGANEQAMRMIDEIGSVDRVDEYLDRELAAGHKIMGFGHRVYRVEDPRASHLRRMAEELDGMHGDPGTYDISRTIEAAMLERKGLYCNVDFYCASVYRSLGIPLDLFTPLFAIGRAGGWAAHVMEQHRDNRLIRPRARYTGRQERPYVRIDQRND